MRSFCMYCQYYTTEYQGYRTEFINYCREEKRRVRLEDLGCPKWIEASQEQMDQRQKVWNTWVRVQGERA